VYKVWWDNEIPQNIIKKKYMHDDELKIVEQEGFDAGFNAFIKRVSSIFSTKELQDFMAESIIDGTFLPAGRTLYAAGCKGKFRATTSNCYILPSPKDNIESIFDVGKEMARIFSFGGGAGINLSNLRPKGAKVNNSAKTSSGAVSFMDVYNVIGEVIGNNGRRSAILISLNCDHPDIEEFLTIKQNNDKIQGANISICFTDDFMTSVISNENFELHFKNEENGEEVKKEINARDFFRKFCEAQYDWGEPGALFIDNVRECNLLSGYPINEYRIDTTNPCVTGDTLILTKKGYKPIEELAGKEVEVWNGYEWSKVTPKVTGHNQKTLKIKFSNGATVQCTPYHKWVLRDIGRVEAKDLKVGDVLDWYKHPVFNNDRDFIVTAYACPKVNIVSIDEAEVVDTVYCMNEPKNHTFIANGVLTGNCGEFAGSEYNACNLGSINLYNFIDNPYTATAHFNMERFCDTVKNAVTALDEILDYGYELQPLDKNRKCIDDWRSIGLGIFGMADMFVAMGIKYGSQESIELIASIMRNMQTTAYATSAKLGAEKGSFGKFDREKFNKSDMVYEIQCRFTSRVAEDLSQNMRNGTLLSIAPTGSISMLFRESGGVEPYYQVSYDRTTHVLEKEGKSFHINMLAVENLLKFRGYNPNELTAEQIKEKFPYIVDTYDIDPKDRVDLQSTMQAYVDNAISSTINLKESATVDDIFNLYLQAWSNGCKGITIFRDNCKRINILGTDHGVKRADVENKEVKNPVPKVEIIKEPVTIDDMQARQLDNLEPVKRNGVKSLWGRTFVYHTACVRNFYVTVNVKDNHIFEVFVGAETGCQANISTIARLTSYALRLGGKALDIADELSNANCPACSYLMRSGRKDISKSCASCIASAIRDIYKDLQENKTAIEDAKNTFEKALTEETQKAIHEIKEDIHNGKMKCPECGEYTLIPDGKCAYCNNCGYSKC
jgi:ribonucleotide reductase alpha subunit